MKLYPLVALMAAVLTLSACSNNNTAEQETTPATEVATHDHSDHAHDHNHDHDHAHDHSHDKGDKYDCNGNPVYIAVHDHEGEIVAHATIDNITYDLYPDTNTAGEYTSQDEGIGNQGMKMILADDTATFSTLDGATTHFVCQKS